MEAVLEGVFGCVCEPEPDKTLKVVRGGIEGVRGVQRFSFTGQNGTGFRGRAEEQNLPGTPEAAESPSKIPQEDAC